MKTKRLVALVLALTLVFCFMAMSVSAATTEIQPRAYCSRCGSHGLSTTTETLYEKSLYRDSCSAVGFGHYHPEKRLKIVCTCMTCGYVESTTYHTSTTCPYGGY